MKITKSLLPIILTLLLLNSCGTVGEGLTGSKKKTNEEFLVKKKASLVLPPNFGELPEPGKKKNENTSSTKENGLSFEEMLNQRFPSEKNTKNEELNNSIEEYIIKKINKK